MSIPKETMRRLEHKRLLTYYGAKQRAGRNIIGWHKVCRSVREGGLGIRSLEIIYKAFRCKMLWKWISGSGLLVFFWKAKYMKSSHIQDLKKNAGCSRLWSKIVQMKEFFIEHTGWVKGNGQVRFWHDRWWGEAPLSLLFQIQIRWKIIDSSMKF